MKIKRKKIMKQIKFRKMKYFPHKYRIINSHGLTIGTIDFIKMDHMIFIGDLLIYKKYQNKHYGYAVVEYLLSHYKIKCIVGETLYDARGFWNKCIQKYDGQRKNVTYSRTCSSSFVIPKCEISREQIIKYLHELYKAVC